MTTYKEGKEEHIIDVLVKFLISRNIPVNAINDSHFRTLLETVAQNGDHFRAILEKPSIVEWKFEHVVKQHMQMVMESWKTTGCTLMFFNLKQDRTKLVLGLYSPKGFIFAEATATPENVNQCFHYYELENALKNLVPDHLLSHVIQFVQHDPCRTSDCRFQPFDLTYTNESIDSFTTKNAYTREIKCTQQQFKLFWSSVYETSQMVQTLTGQSDVLYEYILTSSDLYGRFYKSLKRREVEESEYGKAGSCIARLGIIMELQSELKHWLLKQPYGFYYSAPINARITRLINTDFFWECGSEITQALAPFFEISRVVDTLVPTSGYLEAAMDKAKGVLETYSESMPWIFKKILDCFERSSLNSSDTIQEATRYLSPAYIITRRETQIELCGWCLYDLAEAYDQQEALDAEIKEYSKISTNPFANISISECEATHPVKLWSKYGYGFPLLQKCAYKLLSQPSCCLCNQVEKRVSMLQEEEEDNYILRLNALMIQDFTNMGGQIYQPIQF